MHFGLFLKHSLKKVQETKYFRTLYRIKHKIIQIPIKMCFNHIKYNVIWTIFLESILYSPNNYHTPFLLDAKAVRGHICIADCLFLF